MGLLDLFLQNQSNLDINPIPPQGNGPIEPATGEFNTGVTPFQQVWNSNNTYIDNYNPNIQPNTLGQTGLDNTDPNFIPSTTLPLNTTSYPDLSTGEFNGQSNNFTQIYSPSNTYLNTLNLNTQPNTVLDGQTGLDNTNPLAFNTTFIPNIVSSPTNYPSPSQTFMGEFQGAPSQFTPLYNPNPGQSYLDNYAAIISNAGNQQINTLSQTGLDVEDQNAVPTTSIPNISTSYPSTALGGLGQSALQFIQIWNPIINYNDIVVGAPVSPLEQSLDETGLDIENEDAVPTTYVVPETDNITIYPPEVTGELGLAPSQYIQEWKPINKYYNFMKENYQAQ